ncbi:hypothetical protein CK203_005601 [Vitis vinifera]|uniref:Uncharacterized protein n=1 Tax=Vitis vinifera TaxID=29760 RepID=A0A438K3F6_VITVI|nr:hypothetical protein CK203_005601 [Vitis vinifera]
MGTLEEVFEVPIISHGDWREVSVKIDDGNLHLPPNEVLLRSKALTNEHDQLQARSGPSMGHESCWCLEDVLVSTSIVTFWRNSRLVRMTTQSRLMYPPASLLRKDDNEEDDIDEDIPEEYVLNKCRVLTIAEWPSLVLAIEYVNKVEMETHSMPSGGHHDMASYDSTCIHPPSTSGFCLISKLWLKPEIHMFKMEKVTGMPIYSLLMFDVWFSDQASPYGRVHNVLSLIFSLFNWELKMELDMAPVSP